jgi:membrane protein DedA with SNARE-associated domain
MPAWSGRNDALLTQLILIALATLASEDLTLAATGVLISQGKLDFAAGAAACIAGIFGGDMLLYLAGRTLGPRIWRWRWVERRLPRESVDRGAAWLNERGLAVVFLSRFTPGLRLPTYFAAGVLPTRMVAFAGFFLLASVVWTVVFLGAARQPVFALALVLGFWLMRKVPRWEFWPAWAAYLPLAPYFLYLAARYRSLTLFTATNPGIPSGGFVGESKSEILRGLGSGPVADFELLPKERAVETAMAFVGRFGWPVVLKPDIGERGAGVAIIRTVDELENYLDSSDRDTIIQRYVPGLEFGIFYTRLPSERHGRIFSITEKHFPVVTGDGRCALRQLILADTRAVHLATTYFRLTKYPVDGIPAADERVQLVEIGSHCRGAIFLNGASHATEELAATVDRISQAHPGFFLGRYDVRCESVEDLREGRFTILELNGVSAEATHIYDPSVSLWAAYRTMFTQWRLAFEIGAQNRRRGFAPMTLRSLFRVIRSSRC